jgi:hypothetical protein
LLLPHAEISDSPPLFSQSWLFGDALRFADETGGMPRGAAAVADAAVGTLRLGGCVLRWVAAL